MDLARFLSVAGDALQDIDAPDAVRGAAVVGDWLALDDLSAICAIRAWVESSPPADVTRLDGFLLATAGSHIDPEVRTRLVKFYAMFKIVEMLRYEGFRGFPA